MVLVQLSLRADERDVYEFFSKAGKVCFKFFKFEVPFCLPTYLSFNIFFGT